MIEFFTVFMGLIALISIFKNIKYKTLIFWLFTLSLATLYGLRWQMGADWVSYYNYFGAAKNINAYGGFELGFRVYTTLIRNITNNYSIYLLLTTLVIYVGIFYPIFKITNYSFLSIFYLAGTLPWYAGSLRQMMACVFFTHAISAIFEKKFLRYILLMLCGLMFHTSILVFFPMYLVYGMSLITFGLLFLVLAIVAVYSRHLIYILDVLVQYLSLHRSFDSRIGGGDAFSGAQPILGFARKILTTAGFFLFALIAHTSPKKQYKQWLKVKFALCMSSLSIILYYIGTYQIQFVSSRLDIYVGIICAALLIGLLDKTLSLRGNRFLLYIFVFILVGIFYYRLEYMDLFHPYSSVFYNYNLNRTLY